MTTPLACSAVSHAHIRKILHPRLGVEVDGRSCVRYLRFRRRVRIAHLELPRVTAGRWEPNSLTHPAHVTVSVLAGGHWRVIKDIHFPPDPRISGEGLDRETSPEEMNQRFKAIQAEAPLRIDLDSFETDHLRVECDREHPIWQNHGDCSTGAAGHAVPFSLLTRLSAHGEDLTTAPDTAVYYQPILKLSTIAPRAPRGMTTRRHLHSIWFTGPQLSVAFSLRRPVITHLGWDAEGFNQAGHNRLVTRRLDAFLTGSAAAGASGPMMRTVAIDCSASHWSGTVHVRGNRIHYRNLRSAAGVRLEAIFTVEPARILLELKQWAERDTPAIEAEAWRLAWDLKKGMTATAGTPTRAEGRAGDVQLPAMFASDAVGCLSCRVLEGNARLQSDSYREGGVTTGGIVLATGTQGDPLWITRKPVRAVIEFAVANLQPVGATPRAKVAPAIRKHWASVFSNFRSEYAGFSNHAASTNCHVNQHGCIDVAVFTAKPKVGPNPVDLARFTIERGLLDGSGYGYWRNLYLDADPILVSSAGRIHQAAPDAAWLQRVRPGIAEAAERMLATFGSEGLSVCRDLSGNTGSHRWSSNACDMVGFGHMDAYVNAWTYRALRNATALLLAAGDTALAARCRTQADAMRKPFADYLVNPKTGWVAGWRSRDGQLHDAAYLWVNGFACAFGVLEPRLAKRALTRLEALRTRMGLTEAPLGVPINLLPIPEGDQPAHVSAGAAAAQWEIFCNGSIWPGSGEYYLRALATHGLKPQARRLARDLEKGYLSDVMSPGISEGAEFFSWEGMACGYEGTFVLNFGTLYALAIERGLFKPPQPEWWPAGA
jgi:hypothetical protein